jgi:hypothetical protein
LIIGARFIDQRCQVEHLAIAINEWDLMERTAFVGPIGEADDYIVDVYSVSLAPIAKEVIIADRPQIVHGRAVVKKSVAAIVRADRGPSHDVSVVVDEGP